MKRGRRIDEKKLHEAVKMGGRDAIDQLRESIRKGEVDTNRLSLRKLYEATGLDPEYLGGEGRTIVSEATNTTTTFTNILDVVLSEEAEQTFESVDTIGEELVRTVPARNRSYRVPGGLWGSFSMPVPETAATGRNAITGVGENEAYSEITLGEKYTSVSAGPKQGGIVRITEEQIYFDEFDIALQQARRAGEFLAVNKEIRILSEIMTGQTYNEDGVDKKLWWDDDNGNVLYDTTFDGVATLDEARQKLVAMTADDSGGSFSIKIGPQIRQVLVDSTNLYAMLNALNVAQVRTVNSDSDVELSNSPVARLLNGIPVPYSNGYVDTVISTLGNANGLESGVFFCGDFPKQFEYHEVWPMSTVVRTGQQHDDGFNKDVVFELKVREWGWTQTVAKEWVIMVTPQADGE